MPRIDWGHTLHLEKISTIQLTGLKVIWRAKSKHIEPHSGHFCGQYKILHTLKFPSSEQDKGIADSLVAAGIPQNEAFNRSRFYDLLLNNSGVQAVPVPEDWQGIYQGALFIDEDLDQSDRNGTVPVGHQVAAIGNVVYLKKAINTNRKGKRNADAELNGDGLKHEFKRVLNQISSLNGAISDAESKPADVLWAVLPQAVTRFEVYRLLRGKTN